MRRAAIAVLLAVVLLMLGSCGPGEEAKTYSVRGQVARVADGGRSLVIDHEAVPGFMEAMTMTFRVQDASQASGLQPGDRIRFELVVSGHDAVIGSIEKLPADTPLDPAPAAG